MHRSTLRPSARAARCLIACLAALIALPALSFIVASPARAAGVIYVHSAAAGADSGTSWVDAYTSLQSALTAASSGDQIWVAAGTYRPGTVGDRGASFALKDGVAVYGGFAGTETTLDQRNWNVNVTLLSGDLNGDDNGFANNGENSYHVVTGATGATLDGFTISGGNTAGTSSTSGGGIYNNNASPILTNLIISGNHAEAGGGIFNLSSNPTLTNVTISGNTAAGGGGIFNLISNPTLTNVIISGNTASVDGGSIYNRSGVNMSNVTLTNVTISGNTTAGNGGGIFNYNSTTLRIRNSIIWGNTAAGNPSAIYSQSNAATVIYSIVEGGYTGTGNRSDDPQFVSPVAASRAPTVAGDYRLLSTSPAIDAGDNDVASPSLPATDRDGKARRRYTPTANVSLPPIVDMGAYERQYPFFVNDDASGANTGESWANAATDLQQTLASGSSDEIWVAAGTYVPSTVGDRSASFTLKSGVAVYGGFAGTETTLDQRNWTANVTILSGDLNGDDGANFANVGENSYHVVTGSTGATLDGFTIAGGNADDHGGGIDTQGSSLTLRNLLIHSNSADYDGGGIYNNGGNMSLTNVTISGNRATFYGGGIYDVGSDATLTDVTVSGNQSEAGGGIAVKGGSPSLSEVTVSGNRADGGGGLLFYDNSSPTLMNVTVSGNTATFNGGGFFFSSSSPSLASVTISGNTAGTGGGVYAGSSTLTFTNTTISGNQANDSQGDGGGAVLASGGTLTLTNVTIAGNSTTSDGSSGNGGGISAVYDASVTLENTIVAGNSSAAGKPDLSGAFVSGGHNLIGNATGSTGITNGANSDRAGTSAAPLDPKLAALANNGGLTATRALLSGSPAINAGNNATCPASDQRGYTRAASCDIGAYEYGGLLSTNHAPTLDQPQNLSLLEDAGAQSVSLKGIGTGDAEQVVIVTAVSSNPALIPNPTVSYISPSASGSLRFTPAANANGTATITITLQDSGGTANGGADTLTRTFAITVAPVNDAPSFTVGPNQSVASDAGPVTVSNWASGFSAGPANEANQTLLNYTIVSNGAPELFSVAPAIDASGTLSFTPKPGARGSATITATVQDSGGTANGGVNTSTVRTFTISVGGSYTAYLPLILR